MTIAVCILAKDEEKLIGRCLRELALQSLIRNRAEAIEIHVVANGCADNTVAVAQRCAELFADSGANFHVHDLHPGGKSRAWNRTVHGLVSPDVETFIFLDADVTVANENVLDELLLRFRREAQLAGFSGFPLKDVAIKSDKSLLDRFSLLVSSGTRHLNVINGSLYVARASALRDIWLPDKIPVEDGFLNAMLSTRGFTQPADPNRVSATSEPTHYFHSHSPLEFVAHERRTIVGMMINRWLFEYFWSLKLDQPVGHLIRVWNDEDPAWIDKFVRKRAAKSWWLIPNTILFSRFKRHPGRPLWRYSASLPIAVLATLSTLPPAVLANRRLKEIDAAATW